MSLPLRNTSLQDRSSTFRTIAAHGVAAVRRSTAIIVAVLLPVVALLELPGIAKAAATQPPVAVILDTDIDSDCDDTGALAMLHALADNGEARILAVMMSDPNGESPRCTDAINTWYGRGETPIGVRRPGGGKANSRYARQVAEEFPNDFRYAAAPHAVDLYRRVLASEEDQSVVIISVGTLENLAELLQSPADEHSALSGTELVRRKVKFWSCMGGHYPTAENAEHNFKFGGQKTARAVNGWPTPILFSGWEVGNRLITGANWPEDQPASRNPVRRAYELYGKPGQGRQSWDQTSVLAAIRDPESWWALHENGYNHVFDDGRNQWRSAPDRAHAYLMEKADRSEAVETINRLMMQPPKKSAQAAAKADPAVPH